MGRVLAKSATTNGLRTPGSFARPSSFHRLKDAPGNSLENGYTAVGEVGAGDPDVGDQVVGFLSRVSLPACGLSSRLPTGVV